MLQSRVDFVAEQTEQSSIVEQTESSRAELYCRVDRAKQSFVAEQIE